MKTGSKIQDIRIVRLSISQQVAAPKEVNNKKGGYCFGGEIAAGKTCVLLQIEHHYIRTGESTSSPQF